MTLGTLLRVGRATLMYGGLRYSARNSLNNKGLDEKNMEIRGAHVGNLVTLALVIPLFGLDPAIKKFLDKLR